MEVISRQTVKRTDNELCEGFFVNPKFVGYYDIMVPQTHQAALNSISPFSFSLVEDCSHMIWLN